MRKRFDLQNKRNIDDFVDIKRRNNMSNDTKQIDSKVFIDLANKIKTNNETISRLIKEEYSKLKVIYDQDLVYQHKISNTSSPEDFLEESKNYVDFLLSNEDYENGDLAIAQIENLNHPVVHNSLLFEKLSHSEWVE